MNFCHIHQQSYRATCYQCTPFNYNLVVTSSTPLTITMPKSEYDRMIWAAKQDGGRFENERIIKLLEGLVAERKGTTPSYALLDAITLIKGEK